MMALCGFFYMRFLSGGGHALILGMSIVSLDESYKADAIFLGTMNCFIHVIMYGYYLFSSFQTDIKTSLWWKKHVTQIQLVQFAINVIHFTVPVITGCDYPKGVLIAVAIQNLFMLAMFGDFYYKTYITRKVKAA